MNIQIIKVGVDNCYIIKHEGTILVDAGMPGEFNKFSKGLKNTGVNPKEIKAIVITHCHWDHIGCAKKIKDMTGAKVIVQEYEKDILVKGEMTVPPSVTRWGRILAVFLKGWSKKFSIEPSEVDIVVGEEDYSLEEFGIKGKIVFTPGHSHGSISVVLDSGEAFVGDMAMNGLPLTIGPNLPIFAEDMLALKNSWKKLIDKGVKKIYPAHGKPFLVEKLMKKIVL
jgi:glyoxylase-like metal-dependent hydrolase (beta-lactamase superfamily II)